MSDQDKRAEAFGDLLLAAMKDAAINMELTQLKTTITPEETGKATLIRIIVVPETMQYVSTDPEGIKKWNSEKSQL